MTVDMCSTGRTTTHPQVIFITTTGQQVKVDAGLWYVLAEFRRLGIKTQFSCQGGPDRQDKWVTAAYILGEWRGMSKLLRTIRRNNKHGVYSASAADFATQLDNCYRDFDLARYRQTEEGLETPFSISWSRGKRRRSSFSIERELTNRHGARICLRWPHDVTHQFLTLLKETR